MKRQIIYFLLPLAGFFLLNFQSEKSNNFDLSVDSTRNIILLIGDGMGLSQISAGMYSNDNSFSLEQFKTIGLHKTTAHNDLITDSAAAATAFSTGKKTKNGAIGLDSIGREVPTIIEILSEVGMGTGLVASSSITHATPAAFIAHRQSRGEQYGIAEDLAQSDLDFFIGGGLRYFNKRPDGNNLIKKLEKNSFEIYSSDNKQLNQIQINPLKKFAFFTANEHPVKYSEGRENLANATLKAIQYLNEKEAGFFLMVESSQIDWGGHDNDADYVISEMLDFNQVILQALEFARKDKNTLLIVTGDHETGGLSIEQGSKMNDLSLDFSTGGHTAALIPIFAFGPGAENFAGIYDNTAVFSKILQSLGIEKADYRCLLK